MTNEKVKNCEFCDTPFLYERVTARYCSNSCKTKACLYYKDMRLQEKERVRKLIERVNNYTEDDIQKLIEQEKERNKADESANIETLNVENNANHFAEAKLPDENTENALHRIVEYKIKRFRAAKKTKPSIIDSLLLAISNSFHAQNR